jgi:GDP/UDP-N,N'-diacetylbacillosamine 2-epimerase (hydrolysing)
MGGFAMKIAVLTSSRADYGIYLPLLKSLQEDSYFELKIIAFGTHLSHFHGHTVDQIIADGFNVDYFIETVLASDTASAVSTSMAITFMKFAEFWNLHKNDFDLVFCLGDRYEMFAAVMAAVPYQITYAHLHGGEETLGAIDNTFRHSISQACKYHFVSCNAHAQRVTELIHCTDHIYNIGALSLDNLQYLKLYSLDEFFIKFGVDLHNPTILVTIHPVTVAVEENIDNADELAKALLELKNYQVIITLPNADTNGLVIRHRFMELPDVSDHRITCFENLGSQGYFTAMKYCSFLLGNTSSGIIEAASLQKWVINVGNRQGGRQQSNNIINIPFKQEYILQAIKNIEQNPDYSGNNIYYKENAAKNICSILKEIA